MPESASESLGQLLAELHAHRIATWDKAALDLNVNQRLLLAKTADRSHFIKAGDIVDPFSLPTVDGGRFDLGTALARGPVVLIFFRFAGCPACNIALPYCNRQLQPFLAEANATLVAISPQIPERLAEIKTRHGLNFTVASDLVNALEANALEANALEANALGRKFGILYTMDEPNQAAARAKGQFIGDVTGTGSWELPMPAAIVIGRDRVVRFAHVAPDWLRRTEAEDILAALADPRPGQAA
jgi:peroxiredoxin